MFKKTRSKMQNKFNINVRNENKISLSKIFVKTSFSVLTFILCFTLVFYFNIKHNSSFNKSYADTLLATYDDNNYFIEGLNGVTTDAPVVKPLSADGDAKGYLFSDGVLILDGSGTITNNLYNIGFEKSDLTAIIASNAGFTPLASSSMSWYASDCDNLTYVDLSNMDASNITVMDHMFYSDDNLTTIILGNNDSNKRNYVLTSIDGLLYDCTSLERADLSCIYSPELVNVWGAFCNCSSLETLIFPGLDFTNVTTPDSLFSSCSNLKHVDFRDAKLANLFVNNTGISLNNLLDIYLPESVNSSSDILLPAQSGYRWNLYKDGSLFNDSDIYNKLIAKTSDYNLLKLEKGVLYTRYLDDSHTEFVNYYLDGTSDDDIDLVDTYPLAQGAINPYDVTAYLYSDGVMIFDGAGSVKGYADDDSDPTPWKSKKSDIILVTGSKTGFKATWGSMQSWFNNCTNLETFLGDNIDVSEVTWMTGLFNNCSSLTTCDLSEWNTNKNGSFHTMFNNCSSLTSLDLSNFDFTSGYNTVNDMFNGCMNLTSINFSNAKLTNFNSTSTCFKNLSNLNEIMLPSSISGSDISLPIKANYLWHAYDDSNAIVNSSVSYNNLMAKDTTNNIYKFKLDREVLYKRYLNDSHTDEIIYYKDGTSKTGISLNDSWNIGINEDIGKVNAYLYDDGMFLLDGEGQTDKYSNTGMGLTTLPWVSKKDKIKIVAASYNGFTPKKFGGSASLNDYFNNSSNLEYFYSENLNLSDVTTLNSLFGNCTSLKYIDLTYFNPNVSTYELLFKGCSNLETIVIPDDFYDNINNLSGLFSGCLKLDFSNSLNSKLLNFNNIEVNNVSGMFEGCEKLTSIDLSNLIISHDPNITGSAVDMHNMFKNCKNLTSVKFGTMDTSTMTQIYGMFSGCENLSSIVGFENIDTSNVLYMDDLFNGCKSLTSINLSNFSTSNVTYFSGMFKDCTKLSSLDLSNFNTASAEHMKEMFMGCTNLGEIKFPNLTINSGCEINDMFSGLDSLYKLDISNGNISSFDSNLTKLNTLSKLYEIKVPVSISGSDLSLPCDDTYYQTDEWSGLKSDGVTKLTDSFTELSDKTTHSDLVKLIREANNPSPNPAPGGGGHKKKKDDDKEVKPNDDNIIPSIKPTINKNSSGYINGYLDGTFKANQNMTRGEFCKVIALLTNEYSEDDIELKYNLETAYKYSDIDESIWSAKYIGFLTRCNLIEGIGDNLFASEANIKRAEAFKILALLFDVKDNGFTNNFIAETKGMWHYNYIDILARGGYIHGYDDGTIRPDRNISRIEVVIMLNNLLERSKDNITNYDLLKNNVVNKFSDVTGNEWFITDLMLAFSYDYDNVYDKSKN